MEQVPAQNGNVFAAPVRVADNNKLRKVQRDAYAAMVDLFPTYKTLLADICTGAGKSGVACMAPFALCASGVGCKRMVWIVPTIEAREVAMANLTGQSPLGDGDQDASFLLNNAVLIRNNGQDPRLPSVLELKEGHAMSAEQMVEEMKKYDVVVATAQLFNAVKGRLAELKRITAAEGPIFDLHVYDECHYLPTKSWDAVWESLKGGTTRYLAMTGTPFRTDNQEIHREKDLQPFMLMHALEDGYREDQRHKMIVKDLCYLQLESTQDPLLPEEDATNEMFLDMLRATCHVLRMARTSTVGSMTPHKALGFVESWEQAMRIVNLANSHKDELIVLDDRGLIKTLNIKIIHQGKINGKKQTKAQKEQMKMNMANFKDSQISHPACVDMVVQTGCLSESFDHPFVSVATIFRKSSTLVKFAQFIGRVVRRIGVTQAGTASNQHANDNDNTAHIITHAKSGVKKFFNEFSNRKTPLIQADSDIDQEVGAHVEQTDSDDDGAEGEDAVDANILERGIDQATAGSGPSNSGGAQRKTVATRMVLAPHTAYHTQVLKRLQTYHLALTKLGWEITDETARNIELQMQEQEAKRQRRH